jgi:molybdopterin converting factor small subunit
MPVFKAISDANIWVLCRSLISVTMPPSKALPGHFILLYFATAASYTSKDFEMIEAPFQLSQLFDHLEKKYKGIKTKILDSCLLTINLDYVDLPDPDSGEESRTIHDGDEVAIIPPVSSG